MNIARRQAEQNAAIEAIRELQAAHFNEDTEAAEENGKFSITFRVTFDRGASPTMIRVSSRIARTLAEVMKAPPQPTDAADPVNREEASPAVRWLTESELGEHLQISLRHLANLRKAGLPFIQLGSSVRYDLIEVEAYLRGNRRLSSHVERKRRVANLRKKLGSQSDSTR
jgi:hypothetical protein